ncbi:MAG TPA: aspartate carbamoyltransferase [Candidatus Binatia bacterium]|jgi:aspartate carbamoyltransferase catalytic subunit|nr:aspartate carbamoyltransferase [Candidatus Binatia bacterium]
MSLRHVIRAQQFDRPWLESFFGHASAMEARRRGIADILRGKIMATLFYQPSTRTRLSFETAMYRLGGEVISTENAKEFSSAAKGESLEDTIRVLAGYADAVVIRHHEIGSARRAAALDVVPVINAGDGAGQHPTQALLDLYTIRSRLGRIDGLTIAMVGDLKYGRTVHSLAYLLAKFSVAKIYFVAPGLCAMKDGVKDYLRRHDVPFEETDDLAGVMRMADVVYQTRIQKEAFSFEELRDEYEQVRRRFIITTALADSMRPDAIIMHPLPRDEQNNEIEPAVDANPRAAYFEQAHKGVPVRMAILDLVLREGAPGGKELEREDRDQTA